MEYYQKYDYKKFIIAAGYKKEIIEDYYKDTKEFDIQIVDTGKDTMTGGRLLRLEKLIEKEENFFMTYGDGLCSINLNDLLNFHLKHKKIATVTAVHPPVRFGELEIENDEVIDFEEKPQAKAGWINGGFFVLNQKIFSYIEGDNTMFEKNPMKKLLKDKNLKAFKHDGFWKCMDNLRDKIILEDLFLKKEEIWKK
tara:strand:- start:13 stop:600 length:588 start_codon:yes stop_codon:yes gene_type:complete